MVFLEFDLKNVVKNAMNLGVRKGLKGMVHKRHGRNISFSRTIIVMQPITPVQQLFLNKSYSS